MRVLVTGGNRFVGLALVRLLHQHGHEVTVVNSHPVPYPQGVRRIHTDRRQPGALAAAVADVEVDAVFDNTAYTPDDVRPLVERFAGRVRQYLFTSSIAAYRVSDLQPIHEDFPTDPDPATNIRGPYGAGKAQTENMLFDLHRQGRLPATSLRFSHVYGPGNSVAGREPAYFARIEQDRPCVVPGDGLPQLHLVHVDDVAEAMLAALDNPRALGEAFTLAGPEAISYNGLMRVLGDSVGREPHVVHIDRGLGLADRPTRDRLSDWNEWEIGSRIFDLGKCSERLGWQPRRHIREEMPRAYAWFKGGGSDQYRFDFSFDDEIVARQREREARYNGSSGESQS
jgi:nucleoside-diphosphate-sugar epimerase